MIPLNSLLKDQFQATREYCNAQTSLRNALQRDPSSSPTDAATVGVIPATLEYHRALHSLQEVIKALDEEYQRRMLENDCNRRTLSLLEQHLQRTKRIIRSISATPVVHRQGVLQAKAVSVDDMTLALSALRASIRTVSDGAK